MATKRWIARILWWRGKNPKPRKNQHVSSRLIKAKSIEDLAKKITRARKRSWELLETGGRQDPGRYFTKLLETQIEELSKTEKQIHIEAVLDLLSVQAETEKFRLLSMAFAKLTADELKVLLGELGVLTHEKQPAESPVS